jgi:hypothetical protein
MINQLRNLKIMWIKMTYSKKKIEIMHKEKNIQTETKNTWSSW